MLRVRTVYIWVDQTERHPHVPFSELGLFPAAFLNPSHPRP